MEATKVDGRIGAAKNNLFIHKSRCELSVRVMNLFNFRVDGILKFKESAFPLAGCYALWFDQRSVQKPGS